MTMITIENWQAWSSTYTMLPYIQRHELKPGFTVASWEYAWQISSECAFVLESGKMGRYSYLGLKPFSTISGRGMSASVERAEEQPQYMSGKPLEVVKAWMSEFRSPRVAGLPKFVGGIAGFWSYDVVRSIERLPSTSSADLTVPDYAFMMLDELWVLDQEEHALYCVVHQPCSAELSEAQLQTKFEQAAARAAGMKKTWDTIIAESEGSKAAKERRSKLAADIANHNIGIEVELLQDVQAAFSREEYMHAVQRIQDYIRDGDVFQVNLSVRQSMKLGSTPACIYEWLRHLNPSPYMGYMTFKEHQLVSGSPELLVQLDGNRVRTRPIAGTRPRGANEEEDERLVQKLLCNEKERAEHIMLVDLERNDLGRISRYGTVRVDELMAVEKYSHVMHIVSEITGELMVDKDAFDVIAATFPGGTITGAPKIRTMEIIEELEPVRRGPYTGSIGWIDYNGNMEFNIVIRTMLAEGGTGYIQAGAGIVIDSDPAREYTESLNKAKAMWKAVQYAAAEDENQ